MCDGILGRSCEPSMSEHSDSELSDASEWDERYLDCPKYWHEEKNKVVKGEVGRYDKFRVRVFIKKKITFFLRDRSRVKSRSTLKNSLAGTPGSTMATRRFLKK
jgi:hypothetical protein